MLTYSFGRLISRTSSPTFSDTAITNCHSDTTFFSSSMHTGFGYPGLLDGKSFGHAADGSRTLDSARRSAVPHVGLTSMGLDVASTSIWRHFGGRHPLGRLQTHAAKSFFCSVYVFVFVYAELITVSYVFACLSLVMYNSYWFKLFDKLRYRPTRVVVQFRRIRYGYPGSTATRASYPPWDSLNQRRDS